MNPIDNPIFIELLEACKTSLKILTGDEEPYTDIIYDEEPYAFLKRAIVNGQNLIQKDVQFNAEELISAVEQTRDSLKKCKTCGGKRWVYTEWYGYEAAEEPPSEPCPKCNPEWHI